ncbi:hypothetical protein EV192_1011277 [Actinocrispum wychmicini]|uniref:Uncharacterized protein n=1 Tax=Actinocrispum wychmicini TaxID=1213861 RepID=A0A4R2KGC8_9PSEU|nr:hypothetical protein EV192_1011277 [Actinocrispum wychmicini]
MAGYGTAHTVTRAAGDQVTVVGPVLPDATWQNSAAQRGMRPRTSGSSGTLGW